MLGRAVWWCVLWTGATSRSFCERGAGCKSCKTGAIAEGARAGSLSFGEGFGLLGCEDGRLGGTAFAARPVLKNFLFKLKHFGKQVGVAGLAARVDNFAAAQDQANFEFVTFEATNLKNQGDLQFLRETALPAGGIFREVFINCQASEAIERSRWMNDSLL